MGLPFTKAEIERFLDRNTSNVELQAYLRDPSIKQSKSWLRSEQNMNSGMIVRDLNKDILVWIDATDHLHVIDVTENQPLVDSVKQAPFRQNDESFMDNVTKQVASMFGRTEKILTLLAVIVGAVVVNNLTRGIRKNTPEHEDYGEIENTQEEFDDDE